MTPPPTEPETWRGSGLVLGATDGYGRDRVRWGPIWGGLVIALAGWVLLSAAAVAIGAQAIVSGTNASAAGAGSAIASAVIAIITFFIGGWVASHTAATMSRGYGALNGLLVWALGVVLILALAAFGLGSLFGASGVLLNQYRALGSPTVGVNGTAATEGIRNSSVGAFIGLLLPAIAAVVGGWIGTRELVRADMARLEAR
jgi:hypothetical protein